MLSSDQTDISPLKVGIVGYGKMGKIRQRSLSETKSGEVVAILGGPNDNDVPDRLRVESLETLLSDPAVEAIYCCSVNSENSKITKRSLLAGKHVFCEKPPALTASDIEELIAIENCSGLRLMYGFNHRHHGGLLRMKELAEEATLGRILWMRGRYGKSVDGDFLNSWRARREISGGGILMDQGIHLLDMMMHLTDEFDEIQSMVSSVYWDIPGIEDNVFLNLRNSKTGVVASLHSTMVDWRHLFSLEVFMERGYMVLNGLKTPSNSYGAEELVVNRIVGGSPAAKWENQLSKTWDTDQSWNLEALAFWSAVRTGRVDPSFGDSRSALRVMKVIDEVYSTNTNLSSQLFKDLQSGPEGHYL